MNNDTSTTPHNQQPTVPTEPVPATKKRFKPLHLVIIIILAIGLVVGIGYAASRLLSTVLPGGSNPTGGAPVTAVDNAAYLSNGYSEGARALTIEGNASILGLSKSAEQLAVWRDGEGNERSELVIYSTDTLDKIAGAQVGGCMRWHEDDKILCAVTGSDKKTDSLKLINMVDASEIGSAPVYEHPFATDRADLSSLGGLEYLGRAEDSAIFVVKASNTYLDPGAMTEAEASKATNFMGLYTVSERLIVGLNLSGGEAWSAKISDNDDCGLVAQGESIACMDMVSAEEDGSTTIQVLDASTGKMTAKHTTPNRVIMASDGWIEDGSTANLDASMSDIMKGPELTIYDLNANVVRKTRFSSMTSTIGNMVPAPTWLPETKIAYTAEEIIENSASAAILSSNGTVVARSEVSQAGVMEVIRLSDNKRVASGTVGYLSADGEVLLIINNDFDASDTSSMLSTGGTGSLFNLKTGKEIQVLDQGSLLTVQNVNGLLVTQGFSGLDSGENVSQKTIVYVPGKQ